MKTLYTIGIDFGTSNSCVCHASYNMRSDRSIDPAPIKRPEAMALQHADTIPTVIFMGDDAGQPTLYGEIAEERAAFYPDLTRAGFKLDLGKPGVEGAEAYLLTKQFLSYLRGKVAEYIPLDNQNDEVEVETYVGHPVQWTPDQREATLNAAREAGFPRVQLEGESMAAVYCHLCETGAAVLRRAGSRVMMIDMGGGTTDFAFLELSGKPKEPPVSQPVDPALKAEPWGNGRRSYGGRDLDALLLDYFLEQWGISPGTDYAQLLRETRRFKERFSANINDGVDIYQSIWLVGGQQKVVQMDRETFERITAGYRSYFPRLVQAALEMARVEAGDITAIILTGGHSRWYFVEDALRHEFPHIGREDCTLLRHNHPEQSVARGLCYQRMILANSGETKLVRRKATHSIWVGIAPQERALETAIMASTLTGNMDTINYEPVLVMPEGQMLPFRPSAPVTLALQRLTLDNRSPVIGLKLYSGVQGGASISLLERTAQFNRGVLEAMLKRMVRRLPWSTGADEDRFLIDVFCHVDENEIISGKVVITRYWREKVMAIQTQPLRVDSARQAVALEHAIARTRISVSV